MVLDDIMISEIKKAAENVGGYGSIEIIFCEPGGYVDIITHDRNRISKSSPPKAGAPAIRKKIVMRQG